MARLIEHGFSLGSMFCFRTNTLLCNELKKWCVLPDQIMSGTVNGLRLACLIGVYKDLYKYLLIHCVALRIGKLLLELWVFGLLRHITPAASIELRLNFLEGFE